MESSQQIKFPKGNLGQFEENLRLEAKMEGLKIDIKVKDNGDDTVDISWTVSSAAGSSVLGRLSEESEAGNRGVASISGRTVSGRSSGKVPDQAVQIVTEFEGFVDHVYDDGVGVATIGLGTIRYPDGRPVRFGDPNITLETARIYLSHDLETTLDALNSSIPYWDEMDDNQRSALISFAYNLGDRFYGSDNFNTITSTLRDKRWGNVPKAMELYSNPNNPKVHAGLLRRRKAEGELWQGQGRFAK